MASYISFSRPVRETVRAGGGVGIGGTWVGVGVGGIGVGVGGTSVGAGGV